ncbi:MAG: hypothetical protein EP301_13240 [Gammaproteobacteria bacterium]|jgi:hypothetical protein|nr:MAG: hypothetical protein EP301_13240 [Gammaproteobacteria bacterium]
MAEHQAVARRFAELLDSLEMSRAEFVAAVDGAVSERSLYSILNGHRRPSRSLAVLIERIWGFRADYLLGGQGPAWAMIEGSGSAQPPSEDEAAILTMLAGSPELARTLRRDLDDSVLWTGLWERTTRMLEGIREEAASGLLSPADRTRIAFDECMAVADAFGDLAAARYQRRTLHLIASFVVRALEDLRTDPATESETLKGLLAEAESVRERLAEKERAIRGRLAARVESPSPLDELAEVAPDSIPARLLSQRIGETLDRYVGSATD